MTKVECPQNPVVDLNAAYDSYLSVGLVTNPFGAVIKQNNC